MELQWFFLIIIQYRCKNWFLTKDFITNLQAVVAQELFEVLLNIYMVIIKEKNITYFANYSLSINYLVIVKLPRNIL